MSNPTPLLENLMPPWKPGQTGNPNGRPTKIYTILKQSGYTRDDVRTAFHEISWMTIEELKEKFADPASPAIIKVITHCFKRAIEKGDYRYISEIIQQTIGAPKQTLDANITIEQPLFPDVSTNNSVQPHLIT